MTAISDYGTIDFMKMNAQLSNDLLDTPYQFVPKLTHYAEAHIEDCKENPTIGLLARQHAKTNDYPNMARENMALLHQQDSFEKVDNEFKQVFKDTYPKTNKVRRQLIKKESIVLDEVKPIKKDFTRTMIKFFGKLMK